jgi:hypothetical protein
MGFGIGFFRDQKPVDRCRATVVMTNRFQVQTDRRPNRPDVLIERRGN